MKHEAITTSALLCLVQLWANKNKLGAYAHSFGLQPKIMENKESLQLFPVLTILSAYGERVKIHLTINFLLLFYWAIRQRFLNIQTFTILSQDTGTFKLTQSLQGQHILETFYYSQEISIGPVLKLKLMWGYYCVCLVTLNRGSLRRQRNMLYTIKNMWEEQFVDPPMYYLTCVIVP